MATKTSRKRTAGKKNQNQEARIANIRVLHRKVDKLASELRMDVTNLGEELGKVREMFEKRIDAIEQHLMNKAQLKVEELEAKPETPAAVEPQAEPQE